MSGSLKNNIFVYISEIKIIYENRKYLPTNYYNTCIIYKNGDYASRIDGPAIITKHSFEYILNGNSFEYILNGIQS